MIKPDDMLCFALYSASHAMTRLYRPLLEPLGLTYPQYLVLVSLWSNDGQTLRALGEDLLLESNTLTPLLKRMEQAGWLNRRRNPKDERQVIVSLTGAGRDLRKDAAEVARCVVDASGMELETLKTLQRQITELRKNLDTPAG